MKAFVLKNYGDKELQLIETAEPVINENEVLVQVFAAGINQLDLKIKSGSFKRILPYKLPLILGHDLAGIIIKTGSKVTNFKIGDEIFARVADFRIGTFAEYIAVNENDLARKPSSISMEEAASFPLVALTVWQALVEKAQLKAGQKVFIQAGSGGVGTIAIQLAKHLGAVVATTTSATNFHLVKSLGADIVIDYRTQELEPVLKDFDVVLHSTDSKTLEKSFTILKKGGKLISISGPPDPAFAKAAGLSALMKIIIYFLSRKVRKRANQLEVQYSFLLMQPNGKQLEEVSLLINKNILRPVIDRVFQFQQTNEALSYVENGRTKGKVIIAIR